MKFREFQHYSKPLPVFNLNDIRKIDPDFHRQQLRDWMERGYIQPLVGGYYRLPDTKINENYLFMLANRIYEPSYVSRESALAFYHIIPETVLGVTSVSSRKTIQFESRWGTFNYSSIKPNLMFGYFVMSHSDSIGYKIAYFEKAILDYLYWNSKISTIYDYESLRWNQQELVALGSSLRFYKYLRIFNNRTLEDRVNLLMEYINA